MCDQLCIWLSMRWSLVGKMKKFHKFLWNIFYQISRTHCLSNMDPGDSSAYKKKYKIPNTAKVCEISDYADQLIAQRRNQRRKSNTKSIFRPTVRRAILNFHHVITEWPSLEFTIFFLTELPKCCILDIFPTGISHVSWLLSLMSSRTISKSGQPVLLPCLTFNCCRIFQMWSFVSLWPLCNLWGGISPSSGFAMAGGL